MNLFQQLAFDRSQDATRRQFLQQGMAGLGALYFGQKQANGKAAEAVDLARAPHFAPKAKRVISLHMAGAPSQFELFDHKPELSRLSGQECPPELIAGERFAFLRGKPLLLGSHYPFHQEKKTGKWVSDRMPHFEKLLDKVTFIHTMKTDQFNHAPAQLLTLTGSPRKGEASAGSWVTYGLGTENENLPGFVVLLSGGKAPSAGEAAWASGFLPSVYQGVQCGGSGAPIRFLNNPDGISQSLRKRTLETITKLNEQTYAEWGDPETLTRISQYELAGRMQLEATTAMDLRQESADSLAMYGAEPGRESFANNCLLARRLAERGVRYIQLFDWGWDAHGTNAKQAIDQGMVTKCRETDQPIYALLTDLEERGLLDETLVMWGGEFGRTPMAENRGGKPAPFVGRDHHAKAFTVWLAGGGVKQGFSHGETDSIGFGATTQSVEVRDLHATILHLLGIDHEKLTFPYRGLNKKLTSVESARVVREILA